MRRNFTLLFLVQSALALCQMVTFERTSPEVIYGNTFDAIYQCHAELYNTTSDSIDVRFIRIVEQFESAMQTALCTDIICYHSFVDSLVERIPPGIIHKAETRWRSNDPDLLTGEGYSEWKMTIVATGEIIDTFKSRFVYESIPSSITGITSAEFKVYPNPAASEVILPFENFEALQIFDRKGVVFLNKKSNSNSVIEISNWPHGLYFGRLKKDDRWYSFRFVKQE